MGVTIRPFKALRPSSEFAAAVAALPYDVMNTEEARQMAAGNPHSFLHVDKAEIDLPPDTDLYSPSVYAKAKENLQAFITEGVLIQDAQPNLYIYQLSANGCTQTGLAACVSVEEYEKGLIKRHELTRNNKEQDRIEHMLACEAHTGPIFMAYRSQVATNELMEKWANTHKPVYDFTAEDNVKHSLWVIDDKSVQEDLIKAFGQVPCLYIADGHHRNAAAAKVAQMYNENGAKNTEAKDIEADFYLAVIFPHDALNIMDYNRVVTDLNGLNAEGFLKALEDKGFCKLEKSSSPLTPSKKQEFCVYLEKQWYRFVMPEKTSNTNESLNESSAGDLSNLSESLIQSLDVAVLQDKILAPVLAIQDPKTDKRIDFVGGVRGLEELERRVDSGEMAVAFAMYPTSMEELMAVADANQIMPPKSTWFEPKLRSGLLIHKFC